MIQLGTFYINIYPQNECGMVICQKKMRSFVFCLFVWLFLVITDWFFLWDGDLYKTQQKHI